MRIDAHQHYWSIGRTDYGWLTPDKGILYRNYGPEELKPLLSQFEFDATIAVQAAPSVEETRYLLRLGETERTLAGVVGWLDLTDTQMERAFVRMREHPLFVGIRPMIQDLPDGWIVQDTVAGNIRLLSDADCPIDLQARPRHLPDLIRLADRVPKLRAVVDHLAKPEIDRSAWLPWSQEIAELAGHGGIYAKISGFSAEPGRKWGLEDARPYVRHVLDTFGPNRVMYGSDWPVCLESSTYPAVLQAAVDFVPSGWTGGDRAALFGKNAAAFYNVAFCAR
ncbi:amidohydrolase family protein [Cohnella fermenti]|uniref:Amidohydrolase n=1 Tax=Cohnella fermenti TaxID=2565925 RepID=A0A4S4BKR1_9BACL|nr:amidohydrolase family protein [Cohnella fermenti]THF75323.1 amidohydrolase [Cohnella fermenti]